MGHGSEFVSATIEAVARQSYGKLVAFLAARSHDVAGAEDALAEAFAAALTHWPERGVPTNPEAWILAAARRKSIDTGRRQKCAEQATGHLALAMEERLSKEPACIPDERLALMFACAHPAIDEGIRAPLILQTILGFDAATIASVFLIAPASMGQRLVRAKTKIRESRVPFRIPDICELPHRLDGVLQAIYVVFAEGWSGPGSTDVHRRGLASEAIWLGRLVAALLPDEPEALGLLALMLHGEARHAARRSPSGEFVPLSEQDTALWNTELIDEAENYLHKACEMRSIGRFQLEAAVQSAHAARRLSSKTDWAAIVKLYDALLRITRSPIVAINRAVALAQIEGAANGLAAMDGLDLKTVSQYQPYWAARAELFSRIGADKAALGAYQRAIGLESDPTIRQFLQGRAGALAV